MNTASWTAPRVNDGMGVARIPVSGAIAPRAVAQGEDDAAGLSR